jgi:phosphoserine phosphatase
MQVINTDNTVFFDVDDTLVMWSESDIYKTRIEIKDPYSEGTEHLYVNDSHVKMLKRMKNRGKTIVVWSHGGYLWAQAVVEALELTEFVDLAMTKMEDYVDDLEVGQWATKNIYLNRGYGR